MYGLTYSYQFIDAKCTYLCLHIYARMRLYRFVCVRANICQRISIDRSAYEDEKRDSSEKGEALIQFVITY